MGVVHDEGLGGWLAPFVMGTVNTRVVRRSNALQDFAYGRELRYRELMLAGGLPLAPQGGRDLGGIAGLLAGLRSARRASSWTESSPTPGGPERRQREKGFFKIDAHAKTSGGRRLVCRINAPGDPGYKATAVMLGESALALALDEESLPERAGVLTPSTGIGSRLVARLRAAGHSYTVAEL